MDKPTSIRIPPDTRRALEAIRDKSAVPVTLSAVAVEAMRRGVVELQREAREPVRYETMDVAEYLKLVDHGDTTLRIGGW